MKTVFVLNGLDVNNTAAAKECEPLCSAIAQRRFKVVPVDISWRHATPTQFSERFIKFYKKHKGTENIVIGNSFGAVVAFITAYTLQPDELLLCSLSPFFKEDLTDSWPSKKYDKILGKRRLQDIAKYSSTEIAAGINRLTIRTKLLYGEHEHKTSPKLVACVKRTTKSLENSTLIEVANAPHAFNDPAYIKGIISQL